MRELRFKTPLSIEISPEILNEVRKKIGMLFQSGALFNNMTVFDNVAFPIKEHTNLDNYMLKDLVLMKR